MEGGEEGGGWGWNLNWNFALKSINTFPKEKLITNENEDAQKFLKFLYFYTSNVGWAQRDWELLRAHHGGQAQQRQHVLLVLPGGREPWNGSCRHPAPGTLSDKSVAGLRIHGYRKNIINLDPDPRNYEPGSSSKKFINLDSHLKKYKPLGSGSKKV